MVELIRASYFQCDRSLYNFSSVGEQGDRSLAVGGFWSSFLYNGTRMADVQFFNKNCNSLHLDQNATTTSPTNCGIILNASTSSSSDPATVLYLALRISFLTVPRNRGGMIVL